MYDIYIYKGGGTHTVVCTAHLYSTKRVMRERIELICTELPPIPDRFLSQRRPSVINHDGSRHIY